MVNVKKTLFLLIVVIAVFTGGIACNFPVTTRADTEATSQAVFLTITAQAGGAADSATATQTSSAGVTATPTTTSATATPQAQRTGNGGALLIPRCGGAVTVDGNDTDWQGFGANVTSFSLMTNTFKPENWSGLDDSSALVTACWDDDALHLFIEVTDDALVQTQSGLSQWKGDEIEILFDRDLSRDYSIATWDADDFQLGLSPGNFSSVDPGAVMFHPTEKTDIDVDLTAIRPIGGGGSYFIEASIAWSVFAVTPSEGASYGFCAAISDNDLPGQAVQQSMTSHCLRLKVTDPTTWVTLTLDE